MSPAFRAFGLVLGAGFPLAGIPADDSSEPDVSLEVCADGAIESLWSGPDGPPLWTTVIDGREVRLAAGQACDHLLSYGEKADFWLSPGVERICCAVADPRDPAWQRFLLDTVLTVASLLRGFQGLHASAVERDGEVVAFAAVMGGGKTSLAAEMMRRGHHLFCDDILMLERGGDGVSAYPGPPLMNLPLAQLNGDGYDRLAVFDDEAWVSVGRGSRDPGRLRAIFLLERSGHGHESRATRLIGNPVHLLPHALGLATWGPSRERFEHLADLASEVQLYRLQSGLEVPPAAVVDCVQEALSTSAAALP